MNEIFITTVNDAVCRENMEALNYIFEQVPKVPYGLLYPASRIHCMLVQAVRRSEMTLFLLLWDRIPQDQRGIALLENDAELFRAAAILGYMDTVKFLFDQATDSQQYVMLFAGRCAAFREARALGYLNMVQFLWEAVPEVNRQDFMMACCPDPMKTACKFGHLDVIKYIWENTDDQVKAIIVGESTLCKCITEAASNGIGPVLRHFFAKSESSPNTTQLFHALLHNDLVGLKALIKCGEEKGNWQEIQDLLSIFGEKETMELCSKLSIKDARQCGFLKNDEILSSEIGQSAVTSSTLRLFKTLLWNDAAALKALLKRGEKTGNWKQITKLFGSFTTEQRMEICTHMTMYQAYLYGFSQSEIDGAGLEDTDEDGE